MDNELTDLDTLDTKIFRELVQDRAAFTSSDIRKSYSAVAKKLGVDEVTVRKRILRMQRIGFLQHWMTIVNPTLVGLNFAQLSFSAPQGQDKKDLIEQLRLLPESLVLVDNFGQSIHYAFFYHDEGSLQNRVELVRRMSKSEDLSWSRTPIPQCTVKLTRTDWDIIGSLQKHPRKSYRAVASELRVSTRTVDRRLRRMVEGRALFILPSMNPAALEGVIQADLLIVYANAQRKSEIDHKFMELWDDYLARGEVAGRESSFFNLMIKNVSQAQEVLDWVRKQPGVKESRIDLVQGRIELYSSLNSEVEGKIRATSIPQR